MEDISNKNIIDIKESYCLGEACLIFDYGKNIKKTVAFSKDSDLKKAKDIFLTKNKNYTTLLSEKEVHVLYGEVKIILKMVNNTHAIRLKDILDNYKK